MSNSNGSKAAWQQLYESAALESDPKKLTELILAVEDAQLLRQELAGRPNQEGELLEMKAVAQKLLLIKTERLGWPEINLDRK
jgi:hypothetical protein